MKKIIGILFIVIAFASCNDAVFQDNIDITKEEWPADSSFNFSFDIDDEQSEYLISYQIRNSLDYPYHNLFLQYSLENEEGKLLKRDVQEVILMEKKTGRPYGKGFGGIYQNKFTFTEPLIFSKKGKYTLKLNHYMRGKTIYGIVSVGIEVKKLAQ